MDIRQEITFADLGALCQPQRHISNVRELHKWNSVFYETAKYRGHMLTALQKAHPENVELQPNLQGFYMIFVGLPRYYGNRVLLRLGSEMEWMAAMPSNQGGFGNHTVEESFWRVADMTGESIVIGKDRAGCSSDAMLAWVRFVPMDEAAVAAWRADREQRETKRLYATDDLHNRLFYFESQNISEWRELVKNYEDSDVEWLSLENVFIYDGECSTGNPDNFAFPREGDEKFQRLRDSQYTKETMADLVRYGQKQGLKMCISMRMGGWELEFPYDQMYFENHFRQAHPEYRCIDRDGSPIDALSYAYKEVREYIIDHFVQMSELGCDAVEMMWCRGVPYVLFEEPVIDAFKQEFGDVDPRQLPLDDPRINQIHCRIMTGFVRDLRAALNARCGQRQIGLHARVQFSLYDAKYVGLDVAEWVKGGLISCIISYPQRVRERLDGDIWQNEPGGLIDLEKYARYVRESPINPILHRNDFHVMEPTADSQGILCGPASQQERVAEFVALEKEYGVRVYFEILPRHLKPAEYLTRALELYDAGANGIGIWDTYEHAPTLGTWSMIRRLGHKDELPSYDSGEGAYYSIYRLLKVGNDDVSRYIPLWGG